MAEYQDQRDTEEFWQVVAPTLEPLRTRWFPVGAILALLASVPWYLPSDLASRDFAGLPFWVWMTLISSAVLAALNSLASFRSWRDAESETSGPEDG
ncbi:MAG: hypothetical protein AAGA81_16880 [Acidobacteriota bacterium]